VKTLPQEKPLSFGQVWAEITTLAHEPHFRVHRGEFGLWVAVLLAAGAIARWFPGPNGFGRASRTALPGGRPRPA
jgi:hypothetical protein